ncbi:MAG: HDOD domain-containing protein [Opitutaceae bacterium]|nr:HDOD domain-containing protein [Opitutaceae bacterium]
MPAGPLSDQRLAAAAAKLPTGPRIFQQLSAAIKNPDVSTPEIVGLVRTDPTLSAKILRIANSAVYARGEPLGTLDQAIDRIGFSQINQLVGGVVSSQLFTSGLPVYGISGDELWEHSLTAATALSHLADAAGEDPRNGYTLGLLRPIGRLLLQRLAIDQFCPPFSGRHATSALVEAWEVATLGATHAEAVERLFRMWEFAPTLLNPLRFHMSPGDDPERSRMTALLHLAGWISAELGKGLSIEREAWSVNDALLLQAGLAADVPQVVLERTRRSTERLQGLLKAA